MKQDNVELKQSISDTNAQLTEKIVDTNSRIDTLETVSYTHLDVYKRQVVIHVPRGPRSHTEEKI